MRYHIEFHGPFRVATGLTRRGLDITVDEANPLPASSLKGLMRNTATQLLGPDHSLLAEVFGQEGNGSPWSWSSAEFATDPVPSIRARVAIGEHGTVEPEALLRGEHLWASTATFTVDLLHAGPANLADHQLVLNAAAASVGSLGSDRNRGFGWVTITPTDEPVDGRPLAEGVLRLRQGERSPA